MSPRNPLHWNLSLASVLMVLCCHSASAALTVGDTAADFTLPVWKSSTTQNLYDYEGHIVVLDFFAYWCGPCKTASSELEQYVQQYYASRGGNPAGVPVELVAINLQQGADSQTQSYINTYGLGTVLNDYSGAVYSQYGSGSIPHIVIINGTAGDGQYGQWEIMRSQVGYSRGGYENMRVLIDEVAPMPEPASLTLLLVSGSGVFMARRARR